MYLNSMPTAWQSCQTLGFYHDCDNIIRGLVWGFFLLGFCVCVLVFFKTYDGAENLEDMYLKYHNKREG